MTHSAEYEERITAQGLRVVELFVACTADPDALSVGEAADRALAQLDALLGDEPAQH